MGKHIFKSRRVILLFLGGIKINGSSAYAGNVKPFGYAGIYIVFILLRERRIVRMVDIILYRLFGFGKGILSIVNGSKQQRFFTLAV